MSNDTDDIDPPEDLGENAAASLEGFIERIETLEKDRDIATGKIKAEYAAAVAAGFDKLALKQIVKDRKADLDKTIVKRAIVETYRKALARRVGNELGSLGAWARDWVHKQGRVGLSRDDMEARANYASPLHDILKNRKGKDGGDAPDAGGDARP